MTLLWAAALLGAGFGLGRYVRVQGPRWLVRRLEQRLRVTQGPAGPTPTPAAIHAFRYALGPAAKRVALGVQYGPMAALALLYPMALSLGPVHFFSIVGYAIGNFLGIGSGRGGMRKQTRAIKQAQADVALRFLAENPSADLLALAAASYQRADPDIRQQLVLAASTLGREYPRLVTAAANVLHQGLADSVLANRQEALSALAKLDRTALGPKVPQLLRDPQPTIRKAALQLYDLVPTEVQAELLTEGLRDTSPDVQRKALELLQAHGGVDEAEWLRRAADSNPLVRQTAARALAGYSSALAFATLNQLLDDREDLVQQAAIQALAGVLVPEATQVLAERLAVEKRPEKLILLVRALGRHRSVVAVPHLVQLLENRQEPVRIAASESLVQVGAPAVPALVAALKGGTDKVRSGVARSLVLLKDPEGLRGLAEVANDPLPEVRELALRALAELGAADRLNDLLARLADPSYPVRKLALDDLTRLNDLRALPALAERLSALAKPGLFGGEEASQERNQLTTLVQRLAHPQRELVAQHTALYCTACYKRPTLQGQGQQFVTCRSCTGLEAIRSGVVRVVGTVGAPSRIYQEGDTLFLELWDEAAKQALPAEVDALYLCGGSAIGYDWAISAVLQGLSNRLGARAQRLPIQTENLPELAPNTQRLLQAHGVVI
ncbi:MAG: HEAT repeat domain-containing protein [Bacteroidia bacterium]|nr:HEAT repeat domain-containing protein [Bacteroidia bacterium]